MPHTHAKTWDFTEEMLDAVERAKKYNLLWEFISWYMGFMRQGENPHVAVYYALYTWDLLL